MSATRRTAGFSLIEVMCAILILGVALVGLTQGLTTSLASSKESELQTTAALIAAGQIESLRADGYILEGVTEGEGGEGLSLYHWKQTVTKSTPEGLYEVEVVVSNSKTEQAIYELRTLLFDPPLLSTTSETEKRRDRATSQRERRRR